MVRRNVQILGWTLIWSGVFVFGYLGWQLFGTDLINAGVQKTASAHFEGILASERPPPVQQIEPDSTVGITGTIPFHPEAAPAPGTGFSRLSVPRLGLETVVFEGVDHDTLTQGPGHMPGTALPGQPGNSVVSGHRTTYGRPFFDFDQLAPGDEIIVESLTGVHTYAVRQVFVVQPTDVWVTHDKDGAWLTLTTCNPKFSARERLIVVAELISGPNFDYVSYLSHL